MTSRPIGIADYVEVTTSEAKRRTAKVARRLAEEVDFEAEDYSSTVRLYVGDLVVDGNFAIASDTVLVIGSLLVRGALSDCAEADHTLLVVTGDVSAENLLSGGEMNFGGNVAVSGVAFAASSNDFAFVAHGNVTAKAFVECGTHCTVGGTLTADVVASEDNAIVSGPQKKVVVPRGRIDLTRVFLPHLFKAGSLVEAKLWKALLAGEGVLTALSPPLERPARPATEGPKYPMPAATRSWSDVMAGVALGSDEDACAVLRSWSGEGVEPCTALDDLRTKKLPECPSLIHAVYGYVEAFSKERMFGPLSELIDALLPRETAFSYVKHAALTTIEADDARIDPARAERWLSACERYIGDDRWFVTLVRARLRHAEYGQVAKLLERLANNEADSLASVWALQHVCIAIRQGGGSAELVAPLSKMLACQSMTAFFSACTLLELSRRDIAVASSELLLRAAHLDPKKEVCEQQATSACALVAAIIAGDVVDVPTGVRALEAMLRPSTIAEWEAVTDTGLLPMLAKEATKHLLVAVKKDAKGTAAGIPKAWKKKPSPEQKRVLVALDRALDASKRS